MVRRLLHLRCPIYNFKFSTACCAWRAATSTCETRVRAETGDCRGPPPPKLELLCRSIFSGMRGSLQPPGMFHSPRPDRRKVDDKTRSRKSTASDDVTASEDDDSVSVASPLLLLLTVELGGIERSKTTVSPPLPPVKCVSQSRRSASTCSRSSARCRRWCS